MLRSLVAFGPKQRALGEAAKTGEISNFRNTVGSLKRLIGRTAQDTEITQVESKFTNATVVDVNGTVGVQVSVLFDRDECGQFFDRGRGLDGQRNPLGFGLVIGSNTSWRAPYTFPYRAVSRIPVVDSA